MICILYLDFVRFVSAQIEIEIVVIWNFFSSVQLDIKLKKRRENSIPISSHVLLCFLYKHNNDDFLTIFRRFPNTFRRFPKILQKLSEGQAIVSEHFPKICEEEPMMLRSYSNTSEYFLRDYVTVAMVIILVTMATPISSHVKDKKSIFTVRDKDMNFY